MKTKTQELVTAGYALAKGLDAESAKLVKALATELAVQRVRADELNKRAVSLAVENAGLKSAKEIVRHLNCNREEANFCGIDDDFIDAAVEAMITPSTDAAIANIQAQGGDRLADHLSGLNIMASEASVREFAAQIRKEPAHD